ncbi:hypothetical protein FRC02_003409 [Tulasnella sp. 418]|nr:hypothetical protein FRC02_003409 [Tulasnella sp. 418]
MTTPTTVDFEVPEPYMQRDRERLPRLPYQQGLFGSSTTLEVASFDSALSGPIQSSEIRDGVVFGGDLTSVQTPLAWTGDIDFQFLDSQSVCTPSLIVACDDWAISASSGVLLFTLSSRVVLYSTARKTAREIDYGFHVKSTSSVAHSLSPDGKTLVRWTLDEENQGKVHYYYNLLVRSIRNLTSSQLLPS